MRQIKPGDWVKHERIEPALYVQKVEDGTAWLRSPGADGLPFPVWFALPVRELFSCQHPDDTEALF